MNRITAKNNNKYNCEPNDIPEGVFAVNQHKFDVVLADPPWPRGQTGARGASQHYKLMRLKDIKNMPIKDMTTDDAVLYLWTTNGGLKDALEVMEAWGFDYRTNFAWHKTNLGVGVYNRTTHELLLFGIKKPRLPAIKNQPSCNLFPTQDHSHKPEEYYAIIERSYPSARYLELFARNRTTHKDWYIWGNEAEGGSDVYIPGYPVPEYSDRVKFAKDGDLTQEDAETSSSGTSTPSAPTSDLDEAFESDIFTDADIAAEEAD